MWFFVFLTHRANLLQFRITNSLPIIVDQSWPTILCFLSSEIYTILLIRLQFPRFHGGRQQSERSEEQGIGIIRKIKILAHERKLLKVIIWLTKQGTNSQMSVSFITFFCMCVTFMSPCCDTVKKIWNVLIGLKMF